MSSFARRILPLTLLIYFLFCGSDSAQTYDSPNGFDRSDFYGIVKYAIKNYIDPQSINVDYSYRVAAETALKSLPYPLVLMNRDYYENQSKLMDAERITPGKPVNLPFSKEYLVLVPDYEKLEKNNKKRQARERAQNKKLTLKQRRERFAKLREKFDREKELLEDSWRKVSFGRSDFDKIIGWIDSNQEKYNKLPPTFTGEDPFKEHPFGMNHIYFSAANGFLGAMDPHSGLIDTRHWKKMLSESEDASFEGIGAILRGGGTEDVVVESPLPGSPALSAGLKAGDIIRKVDNSSIETMTLTQVVKRIRGKKGTVVELYVERPIELTFQTIKIKRDHIEIKAVSSSYLKKENVGVIKITSFLYNNEPPSELVKAEYRKLLKTAGRDLSGLVIDLRNNPGGDLDEAVNTSGLFLPPKSVVVKIKGRGQHEDRVGEMPPLLDFKNKLATIPVVVLINAGSASASEILASSLMDYNIALVVGDRSFGKASVQGVQPRDGVYIKITTARYYAPRNYTIQVYGVEPDIQISDEPDGSFSPHFREEDMWKHLPRLAKRPPDPIREKWVMSLKKIVGDNREAEEYLKKHRNDALKPDYMLTRAMAYLRAMKILPNP